MRTSEIYVNCYSQRTSGAECGNLEMTFHGASLKDVLGAAGVDISKKETLESGLKEIEDPLKETRNWPKNQVGYKYG